MISKLKFKIMKIGSEGKKFKVKREFKFRVPTDTLRRIKRACPYGKGETLAEAAGVHYQYIATVLKTKMATKSMIERIVAGVEILEQREKQAA